LQKGIDVVVTLSDKTNPKIIQKDSDYGKKGHEFFEYVPTESKEFTQPLVNLMMKEIQMWALWICT
jgi:hypothetical protein